VMLCTSAEVAQVMEEVEGEVELPQSSDGGEGGRLEDVKKEELPQSSHGREGGRLEDMKKSGMLDREVEPEALDASGLVPLEQYNMIGGWM
jgi:hypothetical protein